MPIDLDRASTELELDRCSIEIARYRPILIAIELEALAGPTARAGEGTIVASIRTLDGEPNVVLIIVATMSTLALLARRSRAVDCDC